MVTLPELEQGVYFLEEVTAPSGFTNSIQNDIQFSVDENGTVHLLDGNETEVKDNKNSDMEIVFKAGVSVTVEK